MNNTSILDTVLGNIDTKRAKNMEKRMMLAVKIAEGIKRKGLSQKEFAEKKNRDIYWDDVALFCYPQEFQLGIRQMKSGDIIEIDSLAELAELDSSYRGYVKN